MLVHAPDDHPAVLAHADEPRGGGAVDEAGHLAPVSVQLVHGPPPPSDVPHEHTGVVAAGVQPVLDSVPGEALDTAAVTLRDVIVSIEITQLLTNRYCDCKESNSTLYKFYKHNKKIHRKL